MRKLTGAMLLVLLSCSSRHFPVIKQATLNNPPLDCRRGCLEWEIGCLSQVEDGDFSIFFLMWFRTGTAVNAQVASCHVASQHCEVGCETVKPKSATEDGFSKP